MSSGVTDAYAWIAIGPKNCTCCVSFASLARATRSYSRSADWRGVRLEMSVVARSFGLKAPPWAVGRAEFSVPVTWPLGGRSARMSASVWIAITLTPAMNQGRIWLEDAAEAGTMGRAEAEAGAFTALPHSAQNLARAGKEAPQTGHGKVASLMSQS